MMHRHALRLSCALLAALVVGCDDDGPSGSDDPGLAVNPLFRAVIETDTVRLAASLEGQATAVTWDVQHDSIATVTPDGLVTGLLPGFTAVTATSSSDPALKRSASITVTAVTALTSGTAVSLSSTAARGTRLFRKIAVPAGATSLTVTIDSAATSTGDPNLYVRRANLPTLTLNDCKSENAGIKESCTINNPAAGAWFIAVAVWDAFSAVSLRATVAP